MMPMMKTLLRALPALLLAAAARAASVDDWARAGFGEPDVRVYSAEELGSAPGARKLRLEVLALRPSGWSAEAILAELRATAKVYAQCGIALGPVEVVAARGPGGRGAWAKYKESGDDTIAALRAAAPLRGAAVILVPPFSDAPDVSGFSFAEWTNGQGLKPPLYDTVFLSDYALGGAYQSERAAQPYTLLAHELLHVLTREGGHFNDPQQHLLNIWRTRTDLILPKHCEAARANPLLAD